jgi:hypothetical protein
MASRLRYDIAPAFTIPAADFVLERRPVTTFFPAHPAAA